MEHPTFGRWLKLRRRGLGLTQAQLGQQIGYAGESIRKAEANELRPSRQMAEKLAVAQLVSHCFTGLLNYWLTPATFYKDNQWQ